MMMMSQSISDSYPRDLCRCLRCPHFHLLCEQRCERSHPSSTASAATHPTICRILAADVRVQCVLLPDSLAHLQPHQGPLRSSPQSMTSAVMLKYCAESTRALLPALARLGYCVNDSLPPHPPHAHRRHMSDCIDRSHWRTVPPASLFCAPP